MSMHQVQFLGSGKDILSPILCQVALGSFGATDQGKRGNPVQSDRQLARAGPMLFPTEGGFFPLFSYVDSFCVAATPGGEHLAHIAQQLGQCWQAGSRHYTCAAMAERWSGSGCWQHRFFLRGVKCSARVRNIHSIHLTEPNRETRFLSKSINQHRC